MAEHRVDPIRDAFMARWPRLRDWGTTNCRKIAGSSTWSQHSWSNAHDAGYPAGGSSRDDPYLVAAVDWLRLQRALGVTFDGVAIGTILFQNGVSTTLGHRDHVHYEAAPKQRGTPPCAQEDDDVEEVTKGIQRSLNAGGYLGANGKPLTVDGVWGTNTEHAFTSMAKDAQSGGTGSHTHEMGGPVPS